MAPFFVVASLLFAGFLAVLALIAFAAYRFAAKREGPAIGAAGGCALTAILVGTGCFALIAFVVLTAVFVAHRAATHGPIESVHILPHRSSESGGETVGIEIELRGQFAEHADERRVHRLLRHLEIPASSVEVRHWRSEDGARASVRIEVPMECLEDGDVPRYQESLREGLEEGESELEWNSEELPAPVPAPLPPGGDVREY